MQNNRPSTDSSEYDATNSHLFAASQPTDDNGSSEISRQPTRNVASRLLDFAMSSSFGNNILRNAAAANSVAPRTPAAVTSTDIPRQLQRQMSQVTRVTRQNSQRSPFQANPQISTYTESLITAARQPQFRTTRGFPSASIHPSFRSKAVCCLECKYCDQKICDRGMKAILLADTRVYYINQGGIVQYRSCDAKKSSVGWAGLFDSQLSLQNSRCCLPRMWKCCWISRHTPL